ncbi:MAG TPA: sugar transferase [Acidobacteriota bacterium]|nr:sugar transferase [Acidobacteriota bacterium]
MKRIGKILKRSFDVVLSSVFLVLFLIPYGIIALIIKLDSEGPVHHKAQRAGQGGSLFTLLKFRTMKVGAANAGPSITSSGDQRVTKVGRILRKTKLDEIPQLWNVLRGEMSLIGPRPEDPRYVALYNTEQKKILDVKPGLSSPASIQFRNEEEILRRSGRSIEEFYINTVMPAKLKLDLTYIENQSFTRDLGICFKTALAVLRGGTRQDRS